MSCVLGRRKVASAFVFFAMCTAIRAQGLGAIVGTVSDPSGGVIPTATVKITDDRTSFTRDTTTNSQGYYVFPALRPSVYTITVSAAGFATSVRKSVLLQADESNTVNIKLALQEANQIVTVDAPPPQVNTTTSTLSEVVDQQRIVGLPLNGRNAANLTLLTAGTVLAPGSDADQGSSKTFPVAVTVSANGSRQNQTSFRLDGANNNDIYTNVNQPFPFPDALQEFSVQTSNYSARYGGNAGGVVNIITKSGSNQFHGDLFEFNRNAVFNARNFFGKDRDQLKRNQFGGTVGGPIKIPHLYNGENKTFFFFGYQGTRIRNISQGKNAFVPTPANLNGDFSAMLDPANPANPLGKKIVVNDPLTGKPFDGNIIPVSRFDPASLALMKYLPAAGRQRTRLLWPACRTGLQRSDRTSRPYNLRPRPHLRQVFLRSFLQHAVSRPFQLPEQQQLHDHQFAQRDAERDAHFQPDDSQRVSAQLCARSFTARPRRRQH